MEDAHKFLKIPKSSVQTFGFVYHDTNGQNHGPVWKTQSFFLNGICTVIFLAGLLWERQFEKILLKHGWEKILNWECLFVHREKGLFLSVYVDDIQLAGKKHNLHPMWKLLNKEVDLGEPTSFLDHVYLGCTQRLCEISKNTVDNYRTMWWITNFRGEGVEITISSKSSYFFMVFWYGGPCKEMCGRILWVGKEDDSATLQSTYSMHRWPPLQRGRIEICRRIVASKPSNCSKMFVFGTLSSHTRI